MLIPVGATLVARDTLVEAVKPFAKRTSAERELKKFERRAAPPGTGSAPSSAPAPSSSVSPVSAATRPRVWSSATALGEKSVVGAAP